MNIPELLDELAARRIELWTDNGALKFRAPAGAFTAALKQAVSANKPAIIEALQRGTIIRDDANATAPFPLTDVQASYLVGRTNAFEHGGVGCHGYTEFTVEGGYTPAQLTAAWDAVVAAHPMMKCEVHPDGWQRSNPALQVPLQVFDLREEGDGSAVAAQRASIAATYRNKVYDITAGQPLIDAVVTVGPADTVLHVSVDLLLTDFLGLSVIFADMEQALRHPDTPPSAPSLTFRDYLQSEKLAVESPAGQRRRERDRQWWTDRLDSLPPAFALSAEARPEVLRSSTITLDGQEIPHYSRHSTSLSSAEWAAFTARAQQRGLTPSAVLMAALGRVLRRYTGLDAGLVTLTVLARQPFAPDVNRIVGDFTSTALLPLGNDRHQSFAANAQQVQVDLFESLDHTAVPGTEVARMIGRHTGQDNFFTPIVITSTVGAAADTESEVLIPRVGSGISQTPQVLMDVQLSPQGAGISIDWDTRDGAFSASVLDAAYSDYIALVRALLSDDAAVAEAAWEGDGLARRMIPAIARVASSQPTTGVLGTLQGPIVEQALAHPDAVAVVDPALVDPALVNSGLADSVLVGSMAQEGDESRLAGASARGEVTYRQLLNLALAIGATLRPLQSGEPVALALPAGRDQVAAQLAVLMAGGAYVPLDTAWPEARRAGIVEQLATQAAAAGRDTPLVLDEAAVAAAYQQAVASLPAADSADVPAGAVAFSGLAAVTARDLPADLLAQVAATAGDPSEVAYIIFTSGSTGTPKGVVIAHEQARTTIDAINDNLGVNVQDAVLAVSRYSFDLAVYNVFGLLGRGGRVVFPSCGTLADPLAWVRDIRLHGITIWNSVPAQLQLVTDLLAETREPLGLSAKRNPNVLPLRAALLSGDWIPVTQPLDIQTDAPGLRFLAMGGATEGSIWSNLHEVMVGDEIEASVPYGRGLRNQGMWILNADQEDCVPGQIGEITIGGDGVAVGYFGDSDRTAAAFFTEPDHGERAYRTGDHGRYLPNGEIEFLGRVDGQVKIRGHRIELGEIDAALRGQEQVDQAFSLVHQDVHSGAHQVAAVVTPAHDPELAAQREAVFAQQCAEMTATADEFRATVEERALRSLSATLDMIALRAMAGEVELALQTQSVAELQQDDRLDRWYRTLVERGWQPTGAATTPAPAASVSVAVTTPAPAVTLDDASPLGAPAVTTEELWRHVDELEEHIHYGADMLQFVRTCTDNIHRLCTGELDAKAVLFPEGNMDVARAVYAENLSSRYLNTVLVAGVKARVRQVVENPELRPLRIMEAGAGVGASTASIVEWLRSVDAFTPDENGVPAVEYIFSDLTTFFLDTARELWPELQYQIFDINRPHTEQGIADASIDLLIGVNVFHNCPNMVQLLTNLHGMLAPGGQLAATESTVPSPVLMSTVEFQEGLSSSAFTDVREETKTAFMTLVQWQEAIANSPFHTVKHWPARGDIMELGNNHVLWMRRTDTLDTRHLTAEPLIDACRELLPSYMVPATIVITDSIPLTDNGKVDRKVLAALCTSYVHQQHRGDIGAAAELNPTEEAIAAVWHDVLSLDPDMHLSPANDFFSLGGDSLLLARCVGRMRSEVPGGDAISWDDLLREVVADPTIGAVATVITTANAGDESAAAEAATVGSHSAATDPAVAGSRSAAGTRASGGSAGGGAAVDSRAGTGTPAGIPPAVTPDEHGFLSVRDLPEPKGNCWSVVMEGTGNYAGTDPSEEAILFVHDGTGNLTPYETLFTQLAKQPNRPPVIGIQRQPNDSYLQVAPQQLFALLAHRYTRNLLDTLRPTKLHVVGYCMGGLICATMVPELAMAGVEIAHYAAISAYRMPFMVTDPILLDFSLARILGIDPRDMGLCFDEASLGEALRTVRTTYGRTLPEGCIYEAGDTSVKQAWDNAPATHAERIQMLSDKHPERGGVELIEQVSEVFHHSLQAVGAWEGLPYLGDVHFLRNTGDIDFLPTLGDDMESFWEEYCLGNLRVTSIPGTHFTCMEGENAPGVADLLAEMYDPQVAARLATERAAAADEAAPTAARTARATAEGDAQ